MNDWISITEEKPVWGKDVLVYSIRHRGFAVARLEFNNTEGGMWINSTMGIPFREPPTHWQELPQPPELPSGGQFESYSREN